jgi:putative membrane-bound dehydrogenase-like protein
MTRSLCLFLSAAAAAVTAADLPPDKGNTIPDSAKRPVVVTREGQQRFDAPGATLPEGLELVTAAAAPLVTHPIMGCLDDKGRLFVGDGVGVNWNKKQLEENPPNRVLMLEDTDKDGVFDKSTIFADKMTFPQGACWLDGSLYVCSPPGLWKLTDTDNDGVANERKMIVSGFEYTGNAADVHGPFLHPNGRLYWCHGRKGHKVVGKEGTVVHEGLASGIWSCKPDGSDVAWHSLGCGDNPVEVDFTPTGEIIGVQNLYYSQPRGDTIVHWLYGGVYERPDQMKAIAGLPRTLEKMPVMYNFGHVAVSGCAFLRTNALVRPLAADALQFVVTHFNTQRLVRMELTPEGSTYKAVEHEFITLDNPDIHLTDVMEDRDGSLLLIDTGGWFRIGCPASLMAKPDITGAVFRVRRKEPSAALAKAPSPAANEDHARLQKLQQIAHAREQSAESAKLLQRLLAAPLDAPTEHAVIHAARVTGAVAIEDLKQTRDPLPLRRMLIACVGDGDNETKAALKIAANHLDSQDSELARTALNLVTTHADLDDSAAQKLTKWLTESSVSPRRLGAARGYAATLTGRAEAQKLLTSMLNHDARDVRQAAVEVLAAQTAGASHADWLPSIEKMLVSREGSLPQLLDAIKRLKNNRFDAALQAIANDSGQPLPIRLKALDAVKGLKLTPETFGLLHSTLTGAQSSAAARIQAAGMLAAAPLSPDQIRDLAPAFATVGPVELKDLCGLLRKTKDLDAAKAMAVELAKNPAIANQQESFYRTALSNHPPELFEKTVLPAIRKANEFADAKRRLLAPLAEKAAAHGDATAGKLAFESGKGTCIACHIVGDKGRPVGPSLNGIGAIRSERDLLESILFPSNTLARDYEAHIFETQDGQTVMGVVKSHTAEGLLVADVAGQEKNLPHTQIVSDTVLTTSLMPMGLDQTMPEKDLLDLVAYLRSLR